MRVKARISLFGLVVAIVLAAWAPSAHAAGFGIEKFFAANCKQTFGECGEGAEEPDLKEAEEEGFTEAGGWVPFGITDFELNKPKKSDPLRSRGKRTRFENRGRASRTSAPTSRRAS